MHRSRRMLSRKWPNRPGRGCSASSKENIPMPEIPQRPELMPPDREAALALSAAPEHLRAGATGYVLQAHGFVKVKEGTNGFTCAVNRDHPLNQKPTCWDREGSETILPKVLRIGD